MVLAALLALPALLALLALPALHPGSGFLRPGSWSALDRA